jgi:NitT/TauT family transport system permease protein
MRRNARLIQLGALIGLVGLWELATATGRVDPALLPRPSDVALALAALAGDAAFRGHAAITAGRVLAAFAIGAPLAIALGCLIGESVALRRNLGPMVSFLLAVPQSIFLPVFIQLLGVGALQKIVFGVTHIVFVLAVTTIGAVQAVPRAQVLALRSFGASRRQIYTRLYLPAMAPLLVNGLRIAMIFNVLGILIAEMYAAQSGLGLLLTRWGEDYQIRKLMAAVVLVSAVTILFNEAMRACEARLDPRHAAGGRA